MLQCEISWQRYGVESQVCYQNSGIPSLYPCQVLLSLKNILVEKSFFLLPLFLLRLNLKLDVKLFFLPCFNFFSLFFFIQQMRTYFKEFFSFFSSFFLVVFKFKWFYYTMWFKAIYCEVCFTKSLKSIHGNFFRNFIFNIVINNRLEIVIFRRRKIMKFETLPIKICCCWYFDINSCNLFASIFLYVFMKNKVLLKNHQIFMSCFLNLLLRD